MRGRCWKLLVVLSGLVGLACEGDKTLLPTQPVATAEVLPATACQAGDATTIEREIAALYPNSPALRGSALAQFSSVKKQCTKNPADAQSKAVRLAGFAAKKYQAHQLVPSATAAAVSSHMNHLFLYVGLPQPGDLTGALSGGGGAAAVGPADPATNVVSGDAKAGVSIATGAISTTQTVLVTVTPSADQTDPLPTTLPQYGPFYDFHTFPLVTKFAQPVTIGICATVPQEAAGRIQLARPDAANPTTAIEILARGPAATFLACSPLPVASRGVEQSGLLGRLFAGATRWLRPKELYAGALLVDVTGGITARPDNFGEPPTGAFDPMSKLVFTTQPSTTVAGQLITPPVVVEVQTGTGNVIPSYTGQVTVTIGTNPNGGTLSGSGTLVQGVATFAISIDKAGNGYTLIATASDPSVKPPSSATSNPFNVSVSTQLVFIVQPSDAVAGSSITPAVLVAARDAQGNIDPTFRGQVTVAFGTNPGAGLLSGTTTVTADAGIATFSDLSIDKAGTGYTLQAMASGLTGTTSTGFAITPGPATQLAITVQPSRTTAGATITPPVQVTARDAQGNTATGFTGNVTVAIGTNPNGGALSGTTIVAAVAGVATFSTLSIDKGGTGYTLTAAATGLAGTTSATFDIIGP